jgi:hypothetical protein
MSEVETKKQQNINLWGAIVLVFGLGSSGFLGWAGFAIINAGRNMIQIQSQSAATGQGETIAEAYYHAMGSGFTGLGWGFIGLALLSLVLTIRFLSTWNKKPSTP